jgi:hypothetical protein
MQSIDLDIVTPLSTHFAQGGFRILQQHGDLNAAETHRLVYQRYLTWCMCVHDGGLRGRYLLLYGGRAGMSIQY